MHGTTGSSDVLRVLMKNVSWPEIPDILDAYDAKRRSLGKILGSKGSDQ
jgi:hypothetical protein